MDSQKKYEELTIKDPFMFGKICSIAENRKLILDALLQIDLQENSGEVEKYIKAYRDSKASRLDLLVQDVEGKVYNAEMQNKSENRNIQKELPKRSRYYQSNLDTAYFESGKDYINLPETYIVFICTFDPFGKGEPYYRFETRCVNIEVDYDEKAYKIFFNTTGNLEKLPTSVRNMLSYIETGIAVDEATSVLENEVNTAKIREDWKADYMHTLAHDMDVKREGRESRQSEIDKLTADNAALTAEKADLAAKLAEAKAENEKLRALIKKNS